MLLALGAVPAPYAWHLPRGFPVPFVPADNPMSAAKVELGERLFYDPRLSITGRYSCASCHSPARAFTDGRRVARGATGAPLPRNALTLVNVAYAVSYGWTDPRPRTLEQQMREPLLNRHPVELGASGREARLLAVLRADRPDAVLFAAAFPGDREPIRFANLIRAIAAFERTLISGDSPFDRYVFGGDEHALSASAKAGMDLFFSTRAGCAGCHSGFNFSGSWRDAEGATGAPSFASDGTTSAPLRVPTLRNVALTAPYMHDGRYRTLDQVLDHYERASGAGRIVLPDGRRLAPLGLAPRERHELIAFLESLTDPAFIRREIAARDALNPLDRAPR